MARALCPEVSHGSSWHQAIEETRSVRSAVWVKRRAASKPSAAEQVARVSKQREQRTSMVLPRMLWERQKTKEGVMGEPGHGYVLPRKKRWVSRSDLACINQSSVDTAFSKKLTDTLNNN